MPLIPEPSSIYLASLAFPCSMCGCGWEVRLHLLHDIGLDCMTRPSVVNPVGQGVHCRCFLNPVL